MQVPNTIHERWTSFAVTGKDRVRSNVLVPLNRTFGLDRLGAIG